MNLISCSILNINFLEIKRILAKLYSHKIPLLHFDVMDGNFVDNLSFGASVLKSIVSYKYKFLYDVHLMVRDPAKLVDDFIQAGASIITFHVESYDFDKIKIFSLIKHIKEKGIKVGLSIKPKTDISCLIDYLPYIDLVLIMSVEPGYGGQKFIESSLLKIKKLKDYIKEKHYPIYISVDGGVTSENSKAIREAGADILVSGSYLLNNIRKGSKM